MGLIRFCGEGKIDSIPPIYDYIYKYETKFGSQKFIGMKDSVWYQLNFNEKPKQIPYKNYIGKGLFIEDKGKQTNLYSIERGLVLLDTTNRFSKFLNNFHYYNCEEYLCSLEENNSSLYCFPTPDFKFNNINSYCLENIDVITLRDTKIKAKKNKAKQTKYGLNASYLYSEGAEILPCVYDTIFGGNYCVFAKKSNMYEIYNGLNKRLPDSEGPPKACGNGFIDYTKNNKHGLIDYYGGQILECKYDKIWIDKLLFAQLGDSLFCYDEKKLIHTIKIKSGSKIYVSGEYNYQPFKIIDTTNNQIKNLFFYNSFTSKVLDLSSYESSHFFDVFKDEYYICAKKNGKHGIINLDNKIVKPFEYDVIGASLIYGYWNDSISFHLVRKNGKIGFISNSLKEYIPTEYDSVGNLNEENRIMPDKFSLKKQRLWYLYNFKNKQLSTNGFDTIIFENSKYYDSYNNKTTQAIATKNGETFLIDSTGKKYYDFRNIEARETDNHVVLEEKKLNKIPVNITPLATINRIEDFNQEHSYAIVFCLNRYFVINKYGEMSFGIEKMIEFYDYKNNTIFGSKSKKSKSNALYNFNGNEIGQLSKYNWTQLEVDTKTQEHYFVFKNSKNKLGLMNAKGELLLDCIYNGIIQSEKGHFDV
ncbi:MAG: hypothetical protein IPG89_07925 [Bacteroidetes bacterium]|nr:hypothetical protein [Bacteroidota bacterium]